MSYIQGLYNFVNPGVIKFLTSRASKISYIQGLDNFLHPWVIKILTSRGYRIS